MSLEDLDGSRKSLEVVLISNIVMGVIGGGGHPHVWRLISFATFFGSRSPKIIGAINRVSLVLKICFDQSVHKY